MWFINIVFILTTIYYSPTVCEFLKNVNCDSRDGYVETDQEGYYRYIVRMVRLSRCQGVDQHYLNPHNRRCLPTAKGVSNVTVDLVTTSGKIVKIIMENQTECETQCTLNKSSCNQYQTLDSTSCKCDCNITGNTQIPDCPHNLEWDMHACDCACLNVIDNCGLQKQFNKDTCQCQCIKQTCDDGQYLDQNSCNCIEIPKTARNVGTPQDCDDNVSIKMLVIVLIAEAVACFLLFVLFYILCFKKKLSRLQRKLTSLDGKQLHDKGYSNGGHDNTH